MTVKRIIIFIITVCLCLSCGGKRTDWWPDTPYNPGVKDSTAEKPCYIWIDASANFPDFADSRDNIVRDLTLAADAGFTDIVVDIRPNTGDVLYSTDKVDQVKYLYAWINGTYSKVERTATWDYLQAFIDEGHKLGLRVHAGFNTFVAGSNINGGTGLLYRDASKKEWATYVSTKIGIYNVMDRADEETKFLNPCSEDVQDYLCGLLSDLARYEDLDGIVLDRGRYAGLTADFSDISREKFEKHIGQAVTDFPEDILPAGSTALPDTYPKHLRKWLEFRAKTIYEFMEKARNAVKAVNPDIKFGVYVGGWYSTYYENGVNWASKSFHTSDKYGWATEDYRQYGYAGLMDQILIGAYASPLNVYGTGEWTMQGFCALAMDKIYGDCPTVAGGPDVGNWDTSDNATQAEENQAIVNSVKACMDACDGYFLFDMIHLKQASQWEYAKEGIRIARE